MPYSTYSIPGPPPSRLLGSLTSSPESRILASGDSREGKRSVHCRIISNSFSCSLQVLRYSLQYSQFLATVLPSRCHTLFLSILTLSHHVPFILGSNRFEVFSISTRTKLFWPRILLGVEGQSATHHLVHHHSDAPPVHRAAIVWKIEKNSGVFENADP